MVDDAARRWWCFVGCEVGKMGGMERKRERIGKRARTWEKRVCKDGMNGFGGSKNQVLILGGLGFAT